MNLVQSMTALACIERSGHDDFTRQLQDALLRGAERIEELEKLLTTIAEALTWKEDPDAQSSNGGIDREWQEAREDEAERWIRKARKLRAASGA